MLTYTRRQIKSEKEKARKSTAENAFGQFETVPYDTKVNNVKTESVIDYDTKASTTTESVSDLYASYQAPLYTSRDYSEVEDIKPSKKTQIYISEDIATDTLQKTEKKTKSKLDFKTKVALGVSVLVSVALAIAVVVTTVKLSDASSTVANLEAELNAKNAIVSAQAVELSELEATARTRAEELGMRDISSVSSIIVNKIPARENPIAPHTNGFDKFCDAISSALV